MLQVSNLNKSYGGQTLFENAGFVVNPGERIGLVGRNGSGKSTLFKLILDEDHPDSGTISTSKGYRIGRLAQHLKFTEKTVLAEVCLGLPAGSIGEEYRAKIILEGLGFSPEDWEKDPQLFSGGYQIRINLARLLVSEPNLLLLDEPTNYLDIISARWLEGMLQSWSGELILITHDRSFMDAVTTHSMMIYRGTIKKMKGDTNKLFAAIQEEETVYEKTRQNEDKKRKDMEKFISRFRAQAGRAAMVQSRIKALAKMEQKEELTQEENLEFSFNYQPVHSKFLIEVDGCTFSYPQQQDLIKNLSFYVGKNDRIGVIGKNGRGKSTLLKLLAGELKPNLGSVELNSNTVLAYFGQTNIDRLDSRLSVEDEISRSNPQAHYTKVRGICGTMMFSGDDALKKVSVLSGGEKSRVLLGKIINVPANLLLLDEPTNHLDLYSVDALQQAILEYEGAAIIVTHEEGLLRALCNRLIVFQGNQPFVFEGNYDDFLERVGWEEEQGFTQTSSTTEVSSSQQKKPKSSETKKIERKIELLEKQQSEREQLLINASEDGDSQRINELAKELTAIEKELEVLLQQLVESDVS